MTKIQKMTEAIPETVPKYHCQRCNKELETPVEKKAIYVFDQKTGEPVLICTSCVKPTDLFIWGDESVLQS